LLGSEILRVSYYENSLNEVAWDIREYTSSNLSGNLINDSFWVEIFSGKNLLWDDLQGVLLVEAIGGTVDISSVDITVWNNHRFEGTAMLTAIPLPPALYLFGSGLIWLIGLAKRKSTAS